MKTDVFQWGYDARGSGCPAFDFRSMLDCLSYGLWTSRAVVGPPKFGSGVAVVEWIGSVVAARAAAQ